MHVLIPTDVTIQVVFLCFALLGEEGGRSQVLLKDVAKAKFILNFIKDASFAGDQFWVQIRGGWKHAAYVYHALRFIVACDVSSGVSPW